MRHTRRFIFSFAVLCLAPFVASCAEPCDCAQVTGGTVLNVTTFAGEEVSDFTATIDFPRTDPAYNPENPQMRTLTVSCPDVRNPELLLCNGNALIDPYSQDDPFRSPSFPARSAALEYTLTVEGKGKWEGLRFEGIKSFARILTESVDVGFRGCCGGNQSRSVVVYEVELTE